MVFVGPMRIKLQLACGAEWAFGPGKADLLQAIDRCGSISAAARALDMSYRRAWLLIETTNRCWTTPLVTATPGGGRGAGARLTAAGHEVLAAYRALEANLVAVSSQDPALEVLSRRLLPEPEEVAS